MSKIIVGPEQKPPPHQFYGDSWERGLDPWHVDAFPEEYRSAALTSEEPRRGGWFLVDEHGNDIGFVKDGTEYDASQGGEG